MGKYYDHVKYNSCLETNVPEQICRPNLCAFKLNDT